MKKSFLSVIFILLPLVAFCQMTVSHTVNDSSTEINTANVNLIVNGGTAPYQYFWSQASLSTDVKNIENATEGKEYSVKVVDANGLSEAYTFKVPAESLPEKMSAAFAPIVSFMDKYFFFDPFHAIGLYDNRVKNEKGEFVLHPNGTQKTIKVPFMVIWLILGAIFFTFRFGFINIRGIKHSIKLVRSKRGSDSFSGISNGSFWNCGVR